MKQMENGKWISSYLLCSNQQTGHATANNSHAAVDDDDDDDDDDERYSVPSYSYFWLTKDLM